MKADAVHVLAIFSEVHDEITDSGYDEFLPAAAQVQQAVDNAILGLDGTREAAIEAAAVLVALTVALDAEEGR